MRSCTNEQRVSPFFRTAVLLYYTVNNAVILAIFEILIKDNVAIYMLEKMFIANLAKREEAQGKINVFEIFKLYMPENAGDITKRVKVI